MADAFTWGAWLSAARSGAVYAALSGVESKVLRQMELRANDCGECWAAASTLARGAGVSERGVTRARRELAKAGLIAEAPEQDHKAKTFVLVVPENSTASPVVRTPVSGQVDKYVRTPVSTHPDTGVGDTGVHPDTGVGGPPTKRAGNPDTGVPQLTDSLLKAVCPSDGRTEISEGGEPEPPDGETAAAALRRAGLSPGQADTLLVAHGPEPGLCRRVADVVCWIQREAGVGRAEGITSVVRWVERCLVSGDPQMPRRMREEQDQASAKSADRKRRSERDAKRAAEDAQPALTPAEKREIRQQAEQTRRKKKVTSEVAEEVAA